MQEVTEVITVALGGAGGQAAAAVGCVFWVGEDQRVSGDEGGLKVSEFCALCWGDLCVGCKACSIRWAGLGWAGAVGYVRMAGVQGPVGALRCSNARARTTCVCSC